MICLAFPLSHLGVEPLGSLWGPLEAEKCQFHLKKYRFHQFSETPGYEILQYIIYREAASLFKTGLTSKKYFFLRSQEVAKTPAGFQELLAVYCTAVPNPGTVTRSSISTQTLKCMNQHHYMIRGGPRKALQELVHVFEGLGCCTDPGSSTRVTVSPD